MVTTNESEARPFVVHDPYVVLRNRDYRRFLLAGMAATVGGQMQGVAVAWEIYERTRSAAALGLVGLAQVLPVIVLSIPAGHVADRHDRKRLLICAHLLFCAASLGLAAQTAVQGPVWPAYVCLVLTGVVASREHAGAVVAVADARPA